MLRPLRLPAFRQPLRLPPSVRCLSTSATPHPLLSSLRPSLKTAMLAKDTPRLAVLRSLLAEITNAAKTSQPIKTDMQLLSLLRKRQAAATAAKLEFEKAGRQDLVEKEESQERVLGEMVGGVEVMGRSEVEEIVRGVVEGMGERGKEGLVMKELFGQGGVLEGMNVERGVVAGVVREVLRSV